VLALFREQNNFQAPKLNPPNTNRIKITEKNGKDDLLRFPEYLEDESGNLYIIPEPDE
jgi:hypothetical protein